MQAQLDQLAPDEPSELADEETEALLKKAAALIQTGLQALTDAKLVLEELRGKKTKRLREKDENDEPTWNYAVRVAVPAGIYCTERFLAYAEQHGFNAEQARILMNGAPPDSGSKYEGFRKYYQRNVGQKNGKWARWDLVWFKWVREQRERKTKQDTKPKGAGTRFGQLRARGRS